jgi:hypothetical protein
LRFWTLGIVVVLGGFVLMEVVAAPVRPVAPPTAPPARQGPWSPVVPATPAQPPSQPVNPVQPVAPNNSYILGPGMLVPPVPDGPPLDAPPPILPGPVDNFTPPPFDLPAKGTVMEDKYTAPQYRKAGKEYESILAEDKAWHSVYGRVAKVLPGNGLMVKGFYCSRKVESPAFILPKGLPVPCTFLLTNCPQGHIAGEPLQKVYRAKFLGQAAFKDEVTGTNYLACVFDHGIFPKARSVTNSASTKL